MHSCKFVDDILRILNNFYKKKEIVDLSNEEGLDSKNNYFFKISIYISICYTISCALLGKLFHQAYVSFRRFCIESESLPADLHICLSDVINGAGNVSDIFPYFMQHAKIMFPHLECMDDLVKISDLRHPANW